MAWACGIGIHRTSSRLRYLHKGKLQEKRWSSSHLLSRLGNRSLPFFDTENEVSLLWSSSQICLLFISGNPVRVWFYGEGLRITPMLCSAVGTAHGGSEVVRKVYRSSKRGTTPLLGGWAFLSRGRLSVHLLEILIGKRVQCPIYICSTEFR